MHNRTLLLAVGLAGVVLLPFASQQAFGQSSPPPEVEIVNTLQRTLSSRGWEDGAVIIDNARGLKRYPEFSKLLEMMQRDWKAVVSNVMASKPEPMQRAVLLVAAHSLQPEQYRGFLDLMLDQTELGALSKQEMIWTIFPPHPKLAQVWISSFGDQRTVTAVKRVKRIFADDVSLQSYCQRLLTGELQREADEVAKQMANPTARNQLSKQPDVQGVGSLRPTAAAHPGEKEATPAPTSDAPSSTTWALIVVLIVAATGLLWLLLKRRS